MPFVANPSEAGRPVKLVVVVRSVILTPNGMSA